MKFTNSIINIIREIVYDKYGSDYIANYTAVRMICGCGVDD